MNGPDLTKIKTPMFLPTNRRAPPKGRDSALTLEWPHVTEDELREALEGDDPSKINMPRKMLARARAHLRQAWITLNAAKLLWLEKDPKTAERLEQLTLKTAALIDRYPMVVINRKGQDDWHPKN